MPLSANLRMEIASARTDPRRMLFSGSPLIEDESLLMEVGNDLSRLDQVERDGHIAGILDKRRLNVTRHEWEVKPASDDPKDKKAADIVRANFLKLNIDEATEHLMDAIWKGFSVCEVLWDIDKTLDRIVVTELRSRPQDRFVFKLPEETAKLSEVNHLGYQLRVTTHNAAIDGVPAPARKFLVHSRGSKIGNPMGRPLLGAILWWLSNFKREVIKFWLIHLDNFSSPTPKGTYPFGNTNLKTEVLEAMQSIGNSGYVVVPENVNIELLDTAARTGDPFENFIEWVNREASKAILGETLSTQEGVSGGSRAAAQVHAVGSSVYLAKRDSDLITPCFNQLAAWITELNVPGATPPTVWRLFPELETQTNLNQTAARDKIIKDISGRKLSLQYLLDTYGVEFEEESIESKSSNAVEPDRAGSDGSANMAAPLIGTLGIGGSQALMNFLGQYQHLGMTTDNAIAILGGVFGISRLQAMPMLPKESSRSSDSEKTYSGTSPGLLESVADVESELFEWETSEVDYSSPGKYSHISFIPPASVRAAAARGLELRAKQPPSKKGGLDVKQAAAEGIGSGVQRATDLKNGRQLSSSTLRRMKAYFDRHQSDKNAEGWGSESAPSKGYQAWLLWGGDPGYSWARKICAQMDAADAKDHSENVLIGWWDTPNLTKRPFLLGTTEDLALTSVGFVRSVNLNQD